MEATITLAGKLFNPDGAEAAYATRKVADCIFALQADGSVKVTFSLSEELEAAYLSDASMMFEKPIAG